MPAIQLRNVPPELYSKLKENSQRHHRSIAGEALSILESALRGETYPTGRELFDAVSAVREKIRQSYGSSSSSVHLIREDRER